MTASTGYILAVLAVGFVVTLGLRAIPFAILKPLRKSRVVKALSIWMPVGILAILAAATFRGAVVEAPGRILPALVAVSVTVAVHLLFGRRTLLSVGAGTLTFVLLVNLF
ncbi:branched-chain amino acid transporter permease [Microbacterium indicum]|uniref:branched-chain amino acid transporter permease n=1 Tax=Microbacterium indicum TaxID=358100 RepID=UPI0004296777|nr:AzlD domain-containing protein [Microbacterium indicum]